MIDYDILQTALLKAMDIEIREAEEYLKDRSYAPTPEFEEVMQKLLSDQKKGALTLHTAKAVGFLLR